MRVGSRACNIVSMKALVYNGPGNKALEERPKPQVATATDAVVRVTKSTICGTDLHILKGDVPSCKPGRILGHEGIGIVEQIGTGVAEFSVGDRVLISCITSCGKCDYCRRGMYSHCLRGGWILGHRIDGTQAE
jgi:alcohol dehydrogenase